MESVTSFPITIVAAKVAVDVVSATGTKVINRLTTHPRTTISTGVLVLKPTPITAQQLLSWVSMKVDEAFPFPRTHALADKP